MSVARSDMQPSVQPSDLRGEGLQLFAQKAFAAAIDCFERWLESHPDDHEVLNSLARSLELVGRLEEALSCVNRCLALQPDFITDFVNRAHLLERLSRPAEALESLNRALDLNPAHVEILIKRAHVLHRLGRREDAFESADRAVKLNPQQLSALNMRGMLLDDLGRRSEACADFEAILAMDPGYADAITNRAILHARAGEFAEALAAYDRSLALKPAQSNAIYNRAVVRLVLGDWIQGFREFESRWTLFPHEASRLRRLAPMWDGQADLNGKTLLLHHEQGYGDTLQLCRYATVVKRRGAKVVIAVPAALKRLMSTLAGSPSVASESEPVPQHDFHCPLMSLPMTLGTTPSTVPASVPYLRADPKIAHRWHEQLGARQRVRIGLCWSGRRYPPINTTRDMSFDAVALLLSLDADFYCLQTELTEEERSRLAAHANIRWFGDQFGDFADTAGLIVNLDLVITVDSAVAHLAGALGKPVWLMNRYATCWRWLLQRSDSPWYPNLRLFRQPALGDWASVVRKVYSAGTRLIANRRSVPEVKIPVSPTVSTPPLDIQKRLQDALQQHQAGHLEQATLLYRQILVDDTEQADALHYLGIALAQQGRHAEALVPLAAAIERIPNQAAVHTHHGNALAGLSRYEEALGSYNHAIACDPAFAEGHYNRGVALTAIEQPAAALASYDRAIECHPGHTQAHNNRGILLMNLERWSDARAAFDRAIGAQPLFVDALINRSHVLRREHRYEDALACADLALSNDPDQAEAHNSRGAALADLGRAEEALQSYERALALRPSLAEAIWNKGLIELANGDFLPGWQHYESRWEVKSLRLTQRYADRPRLRAGDSVVGRTVLLHAEQGYGDTLQFSRYASVLAARGARVVLSVPTAVKSLFAAQADLYEVVTPDQTPAFDLHCPLMSAPAICGTELDTIPRSVPYLTADTAAVRRWAREIASADELPKIGLVWAGRATHHNDANRSIPLGQLGALAELPARWISLQKDIRASDERVLAATPAIHRYDDRLTDFADTAALIMNLDLVITVDTAVAHLAGAVGKPVWILLPYVADWRWLHHRQDSPWYPTARLFRQSELRDWLPVVMRVSEEMQTFLKNWPMQHRTHRMHG
jgi:tetratricopeptide (TPR) repeat protein